MFAGALLAATNLRSADSETQDDTFKRGKITAATALSQHPYVVVAIAIERFAMLLLLLLMLLRLSLLLILLLAPSLFLLLLSLPNLLYFCLG